MEAAPFEAPMGAVDAAVTRSASVQVVRRTHGIPGLWSARAVGILPSRDDRRVFQRQTDRVEAFEQ